MEHLHASRPRMLAAQWSVYAGAHGDRANLVVHLVTVPVFMAGTLAVLSAPFVGLLAAPIGAAAMLSALGLQRAGHARERAPLVPFDGPWDAIARLFVEQWITFPRFVASGGLARAWRAAGRR